MHIQNLNTCQNTWKTLKFNEISGVRRRWYTQTSRHEGSTVYQLMKLVKNLSFSNCPSTTPQQGNTVQENHTGNLALKGLQKIPTDLEWWSLILAAAKLNATATTNCVNVHIQWVMLVLDSVVWGRQPVFTCCSPIEINGLGKHTLWAQNATDNLVFMVHVYADTPMCANNWVCHVIQMSHKSALTWV